MNTRYIFFCFTAAFFLLLLHSLYAAGTESEHRLAWQPPQFFPVNEEDYIEVLSFEGAVYTDTLPELPLFGIQKELSIPHFNYEFHIGNTVFVSVSEREDAMLRDAGFFADSIMPYLGLQRAQKKTFAVFNFFPFIYDADTDEYSKLVSFTLETIPYYDPEIKNDSAHTYAGNSMLAEGRWYKLCVEETGVYRIDYDDLEALGIDPATVSKANIRLFGNGGGMLPETNSEFAYDDLIENAVYVSGSSGTFGPGDYILFYGESPDRWYFDEDFDLYRYERHLYTNKNCYYLTADLGAGKRIGLQESISDTPTHQVTAFRDYAVHQRDLDNLIGSGRVWFGEVFDATLNRQFTFDFPNLETNTEAAVEAFLAARSPVPSSFTVDAGNSQKQMSIAAINPAHYNGYYVRTVTDFLNFIPSAQNNVVVNLTYNRPASGTRGWLNYLVLNVSRQLRFEGGQMAVRFVENIGNGNIHEYTLADAGSQLTLWDVSDRFNIRQQETTPDGNGLHFRLPGDMRREMIAFDGSSFPAPELLGRIPNQNLHGMTVKDLIIVSPVEFIEEAERLADYRREHNGLSAAVVTTEQVYNEFSSGKPDVSAIRNYMRMFYDRAAAPSEMPRYLLLFGNGTLDNKDLLGYGGNLIPTFQSMNSYSPELTYMTDDFFGLLDFDEGEDAEGVLDIGIGRLPVRTLEEASVLVDKIIRYEKRVPGMAPGADNIEYTGMISNYADWRNIVVFIADDGDNNTHFNHAEILTGSIKQNYPQYNLQKIYLDAYQQVTMAGGARQPEVNRAINERVNQGALMINYIGHGGTKGLADQRILTFEDIATWNNTYNMPVFMTATCEFSSFDQPDPEELSAGVRIVLRPEGGTVALYTTTRLAWSSHNLVLNRNFMETVFVRDDQGDHHHLGDLIRIAKQKSSSGSTPRQLRNFVLLGDPSMQMAYPEYRIVTEQVPDTIKAFQEVTVSGYIADRSGNLIDNYNGILYPTIYDKEKSYTTLGNNPDSNPAQFSMRNSILYKGKTSVTDGAFSFRFMVPKDISYEYGAGKISYYLDDGVIDGQGFYADFIIGGTMDDYIPDAEGPEIRLFMNDTTFVSGDHTNENPILLALLDGNNSGINITGSIGHDIVAYLNENWSEPIRLNNFFEADLDTYHSGRVVYPFYRLNEGKYSLSLRAWNLHNVPATAAIEFVVSSTDQLILENLMNYPNPFNQETWFVFNHNLALSEMDVQIDIFDLQGRLVNTIRETVFPAGFQSTPIRWDGMSNDGRPLVNGIYVYRLTMTAPNGKQVRQSERLMIIR
jgi:hypothetical protein